MVKNAAAKRPTQAKPLRKTVKKVYKEGGVSIGTYKSGSVARMKASAVRVQAAHQRIRSRLGL